MALSSGPSAPARAETGDAPETHAQDGPEAASGDRAPDPSGEHPAALSGEPSNAASAESRPKGAERRALDGNSTLAQWQAASAAERSRLAVEIARTRLGADAEKIDVATMAMEITGCLSATAKDSRLGEWTVAAAAETCLTAPELPAR